MSEATFSHQWAVGLLVTAVIILPFLILIGWALMKAAGKEEPR